MYALALDGGRPVRSVPLPGWPLFDHEERAAAAEVLTSGRVSYWTGKHGRTFEREFASIVGTRYAVAVSSGTAALELALMSLDIGQGDEVIIPAATSIATPAAAIRCGAKVVIADVDIRTQCLSKDTVEPLLTPRTRAIIVVHLAGHPAEMSPLLKLAEERGIRVIEDCGQAHGARYFGESVGKFGDIAVWSFCHDKIVTTGGEGGAITTSDLALWRRCWELKEHGRNVSTAHGHQPVVPFAWAHDSFGTNARMTELQAAIGRVQLGRLKDWVTRRQTNAGLLTGVLRELDAVRVDDPPAHIQHSYWRFYAHIRPEALRYGWNRDRVVNAVIAEGIPCGPGGCAEIYREPAFRALPDIPTHLPVAAQLGSTAFTLPVHPNLGVNHMADVAEAVVRVMRAATI